MFEKRGIFQPCVSVSPPARAAAHKLFMQCHVKELLLHLPVGTACVCVKCVWCILCKLEYCVKLCVCVCCNSLSKSKSLTAALMPAASQVMKGPLLVATDTSITSTPPPTDGESITPSARRPVYLTMACIIKVYSFRPPSAAPSCNNLRPPQTKKINMKRVLIFHRSERKQLWDKTSYWLVGQGGQGGQLIPPVAVCFY